MTDDLMAANDVLIRQRSANGQPKEPSKFFRTCARCDASFHGLAAGKTGERGIWTGDGLWFCSQECFDAGGIR